MAAAACQMTAVGAVRSHRVESQAVGSFRAAASFGVRFGGFSSMSARVCGAGWSQKRSSGVRFVASAAVDAAVDASQAEAGAESLAMYFKAEGSLNENAVAKVTKVLEGTEGVSKIKVYVEEGAATVELVKQTSIQATGVASSLVEIIEQAGFKMQALSLGFDDDDAEDDDYIDYDASTGDEEATAE
ncbi:hypothetical protein M758_6G137800 [Ceratodon purpureus]|uniref:HMA domain-containing protein n=1 Tax=Ceratodon purpureus TaxID=3225 RepID=A0A8T0HIW7_CERPU|nr:hypothetical protein KC19_6G143000 [Ceratodon purpureus]KAG0613899.1 hypothetical protein M758_6G137800 [Ceratodon purpureus]